MPAGVLAADGAPLRIADVAVPPEREVELDVVLDQVSEGVMVSGTISCTWVGECARCLRDVDGESVAEVRELFETSPTDGESYELGHELVDLEPMVRDAVLLELPIEAVRCPFPDPCPHAPAQLGDASGDADGAEAETPSSAAGGLADPRWAALDELQFDDED